MLDSPAIIEEIHSSLKASLHRGRPQKEIDQDVVAASKRVLLEQIAFEPSKAPYTMQLDQLRAKYISLNAGAAGVVGTPTSSSKIANGGDTVQQGGTPNGQASNGGDLLPLPKVTLYPEERVRMEWLRQGRIGAGLVNMGNTCFFNSTLQCLTYTAPLVNYCLSNEHKQKCAKNGFCMMCEIQDHIKTSLECGGKSLRPHSILQKLRCIAKHMKWGRQEDAHEFLRFVVDHLQQACLNGFTKLDRFSKETTVINQIFGGYLQSQVICLRCQAKSNTFDPFMDISLDIKGVNTVEEALLKFVKPETLDQDNAYKCPKCKHKVRAQKRFTIYKAPNILTLQLNRFDFNRHLSGKINRFIRYTEKINIRNYMSQRQGEPILYHLYGVLVHSGFSSEHGHYYSFVKSPSKIWYCMNDSIVHQAGNNAVFSADAYVLFYARINKSSGTKGSTPAASATNHLSKGMHSQNKSPFIGPVMSGHQVKQSQHQMVNGLHGTPSSEQGTPIKRQQPTMLPRTLQTSSNGPRPSNGSGVPQAPQATPASTLPGAHGHISFPILSHQQKRLQQQQQHQHQQKQYQTSEDGKHIVLQIKHGNSTTMEKSPDGKAKLVGNKAGGKGPDGTTKPLGLVPYNDDGDSDSDPSPSSGSGKRPVVMSAAGDTGSGNANSEKRSQPAPSSPSRTFPIFSGGGAGDAHRKKHQTVESQITEPRTVSKSLPLVKQSPSAANHTSAAVMGSSSSVSSHLVSSTHKPEDNRKTHSNGLPHTSSRSPSSGKASGLSPLELPVVTVSQPHASSMGTVVKTSYGTWHVQSQDTGAPSPRGSCSSANSVNSTTEWTLQSKEVSKSLFTSKKADAESPKGRLNEFFSLDMVKTNNSANVSSTDHLEKKNMHTDRSHAQHTLSDRKLERKVTERSVSPTTALVRPDTPVDISDHQKLLSSPHSSLTSEESRKSKKHKKQRHQQREAEEQKRCDKNSTNSETNGRDGHSRSSSLESRGKQKKKHKHKKEERRKKRDYSDDSDRRAKKRRASYSSDDDSSSDGSRMRHKQKKRDAEEDDYEWVEVTKESPTVKHKANHSRASVQSWNHHIKDDVATRKDSDWSRVKSIWDGAKHSKLGSVLLGSSQSFGSKVLSWDGNKSLVDKELQAERSASKADWSEEYNQEIDSGKVKKVKKRKFDDDFQGSNPFQDYQSEKTRDKERSHLSSWSQDHSYHQPQDHQHYHRKWHSNSNKHGGHKPPRHFSH